MKVLLFYRSHRQFEEIKISANLISRTSHLRNFDLILHSNNMNLNVWENFKLFPNRNKELIHTSVNAGYMRGCLQALSNNLCKFKEYDYVIHLQTDVFILDEKKIIEVLNTYHNRPEVFITTKQRPNDDTYLAFDFFIFKPKLLTQNIFKLWNDVEFTTQTKEFHTYPTLEHSLAPEHYLYKALTINSIPYAFLKRYDTDNWVPRRIDLWNLWHEHDLDQVYSKLGIPK